MSTIGSRSMAASADSLRRPVPIPGRISRSTPSPSDFRPTSIRNGGMFPTITIQSNATRSTSDAPLATAAYNTILEADYALNADETRGLLAGMQYTRVLVDTPLARVSPDIMGYVGGYYQWDTNWKLTGRFGVQHFGGAQLQNLTPFPAFTQQIVRFDLDRMDDDDNRLFGVTAQIAWTPKPAYQLTLRTPLYAIKN